MSRRKPREQARYWFGEYKLSIEPFQLIREGERVELAPQPAKLLELLLASAGEVVTREAIRECLWDPDTFVDHVRGINFVVHQVRAALADHPSQPTYLETVPRQGYRFIAPVSTVAPAAVGVRGLSLRGQARTGELVRLGVRLLAAAAIVSIFVLLASFWRGNHAPGTPRMAVLLASDIESSSTHPVSLVAEEMIAYLAEVFGSRLDVVAPPPGIEATKKSVMAGAGYVLSLAYVEGAESRSLVVRLLRCHDHTTLWSTSSPIGRKALPDVFSHVAEGVADALGISLQAEPILRGEVLRQPGSSGDECLRLPGGDHRECSCLRTSVLQGPTVSNTVSNRIASAVGK